MTEETKLTPTEQGAQNLEVFEKKCAICSNRAHTTKKILCGIGRNPFTEWQSGRKCGKFRLEH